jgi:thioredoxin-like negative regulator of GroEL
MGKKRSVDVRSSNDVKELETTIQTGPITIVLVYADWCGHCTRFKEDIWSKLLAKPRKVNLASIHHDQLGNTSLRDAKIKGYPSVLIVGKDGKPAVFKSDEDPTNAMPHADLETLEKIADSDAKTIMREEEEPMAHNNSRMMTPPDARRDVIKGNGNLFRRLKSYVTSRMTMRQKKNGGRKTRRA